MTTRMRVVKPALRAEWWLRHSFTNVSVGTPPERWFATKSITKSLRTIAQSAAPDNTLTNVWNDGKFASAGSPVTISNPAGFDVTQFHDYRTDWTPTSVKWYIDNTLVRTETAVVPDDPMRATT